MEIRNLIRKHYNLPAGGLGGWVPAEHISRQDWQDATEGFVSAVRILSERPAFGLSETEISVHYHQAVERFAELIAIRLGIISDQSEPTDQTRNTKGTYE